MERPMPGNFVYPAEPPRTAVIPTALETMVSELAQPPAHLVGSSSAPTVGPVAARPLRPWDLGP